MTTRMKWLLAVLAVVVLGSALYFSMLLSPAAPPGFDFFTTSSSTPSLPESGNVPAGTKKPTTATPPKKNSGYSVDVHGKTETITSTGAGVTIEAPINTSISQTNAILTVTPPESGKGESLSFQKSSGAYPDGDSTVASSMNGTQLAFDALRTTLDDKEYNPNNGVHLAHITKLRTLSVDNHPAVTVHVAITASAGAPARDFYVTWVRSGITNWYIVRSAQGLTAPAKSALDSIFTSVKLLP